MNYVFKGNLRGFYCGDCSDFLYQAKVKVYAAEQVAELSHLTNAREKETFHQRNDEELKSISKKLIAETLTDEAGNFVLELQEKNYDGGAFEIDFECGTVPIKFKPKHPPKPINPVQFHITTLQPQWQSTGENNRNLVAYWEYAIAQSFWCRLLHMFGYYVICGRVAVCKNNVPLNKVKVKAFDVDLIQDDYLGEGITDISGHFKIYYTQADFSKTIFSWLNTEWPAGPDLYFSVEDANGVVLLKEPRSKGHTTGRENVGNCTCVSLCVDVDTTTTQPEPIPAFIRIGGYDYETNILSQVGESGLTTGNYAFHRTLRLNGILSQSFSASPLEYCFEFTNQFNALGQPINWDRVLSDKIEQTHIGYVEKATLMPADITHPFPWYKYNYQHCYVGNMPVAAGDIQVPVAADGWILVPQQKDNPLNAAGVGMFVANGNQIALNSEKLSAFAPIDLSGLIAGNSSTSTGKALGSDEIFAIRMLVREQGNNASIVEGGRCTRLAINNTKYDGMEHHPQWGPSPIVSENGVGMLDIVQLRLAGCAKITTQVDVLYTCAHPNLGGVEISMTGPLGTISLPVPPISPDAFGTITHLFTPADPLCAYVVNLRTTYLLTTGDSALLPVHDQIAFCR